ncbi:hypothetical protein [Paenibacillus campi]|uniref:hypothetical protein n=1 Tax=Paenibacillus campi TaxID=3106031 RepID=UPI002AFEB4A9|nr:MULTISPECIES: hypothetical protein [unclassified Paenibacillus]
MSNSRYYPFERNRYFYGKLLTVRDFEAEQQYTVNKRRLLNRLLFGPGIITGLTVIMVDDKTLSIQSGAALDSLGREIIVPSPITTRLSLIEGFGNNEFIRDLYLCIVYNERGREPVHALERGQEPASTDDLSEHNRVQETFKLVLREYSDELDQYGIMSLKERTVSFYKDDSVRILIKGPRYVAPGEEFTLHMDVVKARREAQVILDCALESDGVQLSGGEHRVTYNDSSEEAVSEYRIDSHFIAAEAAGKAVIRIVTATVRVDGRTIPVREEIVFPLEVIADPQGRIWQDYVERPLDAALSERPSVVCLARISLTRIRSTYAIEEVQRVPFGDYVRNLSEMQRLGLFNGIMTEQRQVRTVEAQAAPLESDWMLGLLDKEQQAEDVAVAPPSGVRTGTIELSLSGGRGHNGLFAKGESIVSNEIQHGFGPGTVHLTLALCDQEDSRIFGGNQDVFDHTPYESTLPQVKLGTVQYPEKGSFRIGARVFSSSGPSTLQVRWWATRAINEDDTTK